MGHDAAGAFGPGKLDADAHQVHRSWTSLIMSAPIKSFFERTTPFTPRSGLPCSLFDPCIDDRGTEEPTLLCNQIGCTRFSSRVALVPLGALQKFRNALKIKRKLPEAMWIETTSLLEIKEFCGAARPSK